MEVVLKRTKITKSIVSQLEFVPSHLLSNYKVLGYCVLPKTKIVLLYDEVRNKLAKTSYKTKIWVDPISSGPGAYAKYNISGSAHTQHLNFPNEEDAKSCVFLWKRIQNNAESLGQIFI